MEDHTALAISDFMANGGDHYTNVADRATTLELITDAVTIHGENQPLMATQQPFMVIFNFSRAGSRPRRWHRAGRQSGGTEQGLNPQSNGGGFLLLS